MVIDRAMGNNSHQFFTLIDKARNALLHGQEPKTIEDELNVKWEDLSDDLGRVVWKELLTLFSKIASSNIANQHETLTLAFNQTNTFLHYHVTNAVDAIMGANHADPLNPRIDEFMPSLEIGMVLSDHERSVDS